MFLKSLYWKDQHKGKWRRDGGARDRSGANHHLPK